MKRNRRLGWLIIIASFVLFVSVSLLRDGRYEGVWGMIGTISSGLLGGGVVAGVALIRNSRNEETAKKASIAQRDERNIAIRGKAAYITLNVQFFLIFLYSAYIMYILDDSTTAFIGYGIAAAGLILNAVLYRIYEKKM